MRRWALLSSCGLLSVAFHVSCSSPTAPPPTLVLPEAPARAMSARELANARGVVERRCMVCHGCYDAPCQLALSSREGLRRGASKQQVYGSPRLRAAAPTRLGIDAQTTAAWRQLGFFSVTHREEGLDASLIAAMLALGRSYEFPEDEPLPADLGLGLSHKQSCPTAAEFSGYSGRNPTGGMPYATASLAPREYEVLGAWAASEAPTLPPSPLPQALESEIVEWETLLNDGDLESRVVARYVFEHWVFAHLFFSSHPEGPFFEIVRSKTAPGSPIDVIATRFPFDDPGVERFWYRLRRIDHSIVHKTHITYELGPARRARYHELFFSDAWKASRYPSWEPKLASNPFVSFEEIPARARYQFLLDDALYFVRSFIRGPVCRGQAATDVIQDRFFVAFLDPDHDISIVDPDFLPSVKNDLRLPAEAGGNLPLFRTWARYDRSQKRYRDRRAEAYRAWLAGRGTDLSFVWDGDGRNRNALLTVFRNFDNAMVSQGWIGAVPKTAWVIDYPVFERIYYDLVAGFDVFGNVGHQLGVRFYMDNLRMESEDLFLALLPEALREKMRAAWYEGATRQLKYVLVNALRSQGVPSRIDFQSDDPKAELIDLLLARDPKVAGPSDTLNRCPQLPCERHGATPLERGAEAAFQRLASAQGVFARDLPEISLVRVRGEGSQAVAYTLIHDRSYANVAAVFREEERRKPEEDRVTVLRGLYGSYPNFGFDLPLDEVEAFVDAILELRAPADLTLLIDRWGVRRTSARFWDTVDWWQDELVRQGRREAGILDINRYENR